MILRLRKKKYPQKGTPKKKNEFPTRKQLFQFGLGKNSGVWYVVGYDCVEEVVVGYPTGSAERRCLYTGR